MTALSTLRGQWHEVPESADDNWQGFAACYRWLHGMANRIQPHTNTVAALEEVAACFPAEEWQLITNGGRVLLLADLVTSEEAPAPAEYARRIMSSYSRDRDLGRLVRYVSALADSARPAVGNVVAALLVKVAAS